MGVCRELLRLEAIRELLVKRRRIATVRAMAFQPKVSTRIYEHLLAGDNVLRIVGSGGFIAALIQAKVGWRNANGWVLLIIRATLNPVQLLGL